MATGIDVFFTGLMLICLDGSDCAREGHFPNTAWVVKADGPRKICGWEDQTSTTLELRFKETDFKLTVDVDSVCGDPENDVYSCPLTRETICVVPRPAPEEQRLEHSLQWLPQLDEVDQRFKAVLPERLEDKYYVSTRIHFPTGVVGAGERWPPRGAEAGFPRLWFRSDSSAGGALPRELSDRVQVTFERAEWLELSACDGKPWIVLRAVARKEERRAAPVFIRNFADVVYRDEVSGYDNLAYLLWYYRLGSWLTSRGSCPEYSKDKRDAIVLRCRREDAPCACYKNCDRDSSFWPPVLAPGFHY